jgi:hypothetical protein
MGAATISDTLACSRLTPACCKPQSEYCASWTRRQAVGTTRHRNAPAPPAGRQGRNLTPAPVLEVGLWHMDDDGKVAGAYHVVLQTAPGRKARHFAGSLLNLRRSTRAYARTPHRGCDRSLGGPSSCSK